MENVTLVAILNLSLYHILSWGGGGGGGGGVHGDPR